MVTLKRPFLSTPGSWKKYKEYVNSAKNRGIKFELSYFQFKAKSENPCYICGNNKDINGLDRVDNNQHYHFMNVEPCCWTCNRAKSSMSESDFMEWVNRFNINTSKICTAYLHADGLSKGYDTHEKLLKGLINSIPELKEDIEKGHFTNIRKCP